jgi:hypothetical protein
MAWWKLMSELIDGYTVQLTIRKEKDKLIVPLTMKGTPDELDQAFFSSIAEGLRKTNEFQVNLDQFNSSLKSAEKKSTGKTPEKKPEVKKPEEKKADLFNGDNDEKVKKPTAEKKVPEKPALEKKTDPPPFEADDPDPPKMEASCEVGDPSGTDEFGEEDW